MTNIVTNDSSQQCGQGTANRAGVEHQGGVRRVQDNDISPALTISGLSKTFPGTKALDSVDLTVHPGQIHALIGQNGSGKSTVVKILAGYHEPDAGARAEVKGVPFELGSASAALNAGLRFVHQDLGLVETMTVAENFHMGDTSFSLGRVRKADDRKTARAALERLGYDIDPSAVIGTLAESERTAVGLARALYASDTALPFHLLVLDEVTASLPGAEAQRLFAALRRIAATGTAILFISHHLDEVLDLCDQVTVLRDGKLVDSVVVAGLSGEQLAELLLGRRLQAELAAHTRVEVEQTSPTMRVSQLAGMTLAPFDFELFPGEVLGIAGLTGSGRDEIASLIGGRIPRSGTISIDGKSVKSNDPRAAIDAGICMVPADRAGLALFPLYTVRENLTIADLDPFFQGGRMRPGDEVSHAKEWISEMDVRPARHDAVIGELSGGNQQKVVIARWLRVAPRVFVLDEPTQGVDVGSKADIHRLIDQAVSRGASVIVASSDSSELERLCTRVIILQRGEVSAHLRGNEIHQDRIEELQLLPLAQSAS